MVSDKQRNAEGLGRDPEMGEILKNGGQGSNAGEVDPGVDADDVTSPSGESLHANPDTDVAGTFKEPAAGRNLGLEDVDRGQPTG